MAIDQTAARQGLLKFIDKKGGSVPIGLLHGHSKVAYNSQIAQRCRHTRGASHDLGDRHVGLRSARAILLEAAISTGRTACP